MAAVLTAGVAVSGCASSLEHREMQRPPSAQNQALAWRPDDRLFRSVTIDYVTGMSRRSYWFAEANQTSFRPLLQQALERADLLAPTPTAARYGLQIEFTELEGSGVGGDFNSRSLATYRIVHRGTGGVVYQKAIPASFTSEFPLLDERDAEKAWLLGLWGPVAVGLGLINPYNFISAPNFWGALPDQPVLAARQGALSPDGIGARNGAERAWQADQYMMAQSITRFVMDMAGAEQVRFTAIVPCQQSRDVENLRGQLSAAGLHWRTDDCTAYPKTYRTGVTYTGDR